MGLPEEHDDPLVHPRQRATVPPTEILEPWSEARHQSASASDWSSPVVGRRCCPSHAHTTPSHRLPSTAVLMGATPAAFMFLIRSSTPTSPSIINTADVCICPRPYTKVTLNTPAHCLCCSCHFPVSDLCSFVRHGKGIARIPSE